MAAIRKHRDKWQAQVRLKGIKPIAMSFSLKSEAVAWARVTESKVTLGTYVDPRPASSVTLSDVITRYLEQVSGSGKGNRPLASRLERLRGALGAFSLNKLTASHLSEYRDRRLLVANPATVIHELSLVRRLMRLAVIDYGIALPQGIPQVRMPKMPRGRVRRLMAGEEERLLAVCIKDDVLHDIILLAIETAMRRSELVNIRWDHIDWNNCTLRINKTKTGVPRVIPLSVIAISVLSRHFNPPAAVFPVSASSISHGFASACREAGIVDLRFHDLRHEGVSRLFELGLNQMEVATISGHQTISMLQRYTHISIEHLLEKISVQK